MKLSHSLLFRLSQNWQSRGNQPRIRVSALYRVPYCNCIFLQRLNCLPSLISMAQASFTRDTQRLASSQWKPAYAAQLCPKALLNLRRAISAAPCPLLANTRPTTAGPICRSLPGTRTGIAINIQFNSSGSPDLENGDRSTIQQPDIDGHPPLPTPSTATPAPAVAGANGATAPGSQDSGEARRKLWMAAIKPPMYSVGFIPVLVGAAACFAVHGVMPWGRVAGLVAAAVMVIAWLNLSNDAFDATTGVDHAKPESVINLLGGPSPARRAAVLLLAKGLLLSGALLLGHLITTAPGGDMRPAAMLAFSIVCGYVYQGPPFRLSYKGLGEPLCFAAFGPSATTAFYLALQPNGDAAAAAAAAQAAAGAGSAAGALAAAAAGVPPLVWACALAVGCTTTVILFCSHFHQIAGDIAAGKRSPLVRLGTERGRHVLRAAALATHALVLAAAALGALPWPVAAASLLAAPAAREMVAFADDNHTVPARVAPLKRFAVKWHILFGLCLCLGLGAPRAAGLVVGV